MGFFSSLFGRKKSKFKADELDINVTGDAIIVNGIKVDVPCLLQSLNAIFGKPRKFCGRAGNTNYTWDDLGVYCYTKGNNVVYCFAVKTNLCAIDPSGNPAEPLGFDPKSPFVGKLCIMGAPWEEVMYGGENMDDFGRERVMQNLSLFSEYSDFSKGDSEGWVGAYAGVEISL